MKKINKDSTIFDLTEVGVYAVTAICTDLAIVKLVLPLLPAQIDLATKVGLYFGTYATSLVVCNRVIKDAKFMVNFYNAVADSYNEKLQAERQENHG